MVGVLAVSAPLEDYTVQPCKKQRKDEDPPNKTITNYFSPLSRNIDKGLSSPKSNNIADYFIRSSPATSKERTPSDKMTSPGSKNGEAPSTPLTRSSKPAGRIAKQGKRTKLIKRLSDLGPPNLSNAAGNGGGNPSNSGIVGSDTAALLAEICTQTGDLDDDVFQSETSTARDTAKRGQNLKRTSVEAEQWVNGEPATADPPNQRQSVISNVSAESKTSVVGSSLEVHGDNSSDNPGILTISFEDFMKSQGTTDHSTSPAESSDLTNAAGGDSETMQLPSPKTMTVQAQVHLSPPLNLHNSPKIASIFQKNKTDKKKVGTPDPECEQLGPMIPKRKSNVVIEEEDLELVIVDVETGEPMKEKSTPAERQQFMKAFRQVGEVSKPNTKKNPTRKKDLKEGMENHHKLEAEEQPPDKSVNENKAQRLKRKKKLPLTQSLETLESSVPAAAEKEQPPDKAVNENKAQRLKRKKKQPPTHSLDTPESSVPAAAEKEQSPLIHSSPVLRRSLRRQKSNPSSKSPERTSSPILMSTPNMRTPCRINDVYKAEVLTIPSDTESPIRMRFTRVTRRSNWRRHDSDEEAFTLGCKKVSQSSKKMTKAKQLLEKAKAIQQNMVKAETPGRRSTRQRSCVTQEPIIIADTTNSQKNVKKSNLRSLNDVLGKKVKMKSLPSGQKKEVKKKVYKGGVITIDDSSEVSENSQDDEQFKAKREFLMSGLPDSLKRQIARTTAIMEAYFVSGSSFQTVLHVQQRDGCTMWRLAMPCCRLLADLSPLYSNVPDITQLTLSLGDFTRVNSKSAVQPCSAMVSRKLVFSDVIRDCLLEEIRSCNQQFPVRRFFNQFLKKQSDYLSLQDANKSAATQQIEKCPQPAGTAKSEDDCALQETGNGTKRKRKDFPCTKSKRRKAAINPEDEVEEESHCDSALTTHPSCFSERQQLRLSERKKSSTPAESDVVIIKDHSPMPPAEYAVWEDVLWTEKYQPQSSSELIGNSAAILRLHSWLREWKMRTEKEEKRNQMQKTGKDKDDTWSAGDFLDSEESDEDSLCNTLLISGPPGVGKTAAVYACAQELGFKVFEVNASCQRSGRQILAQLKEATQSHQVDQQGVGAHKPCFFNSSCSSRSPRKLNSPKRVVSSPRKPPMSPRGPSIKKGLAPKSLSNFFKAAPKQKPEIRKMNSELVRAPQTGTDRKTSDGKASRPLSFVTDKGSRPEETQRKTATSLILFEEVDVVFDDDTGFLSAIKTFMSTTKRPVILTTSDPTFGMKFDGTFEEISFHTPSVVNVASFLQVLCLAENLRTDTKDVITFLTANRCDIRQSLLHLQFWARSGGGGLKVKPLTPPDKQKMVVTEVSDGASCKYPATEINATEVPGCNVGCAENLLGVDNIIAPTDGLISFVKDKILEASEWDKILQLLTEFHTRHIYFTSSNLEFLLPLPVHMEEPAAASACENLELVHPNDDEGLTEDADVKLSASMKRRRKLVLLNDSDLFESDSNSLDEVLSIRTNMPEEKTHPCSSDTINEALGVRVGKRVLSPAELQSSFLVYQCLDSMAEFADQMSYLDCSTCDTADPSYTCSPSWTESRLKHGLCDGLRTENRDLWSTHSCGEIRALIEALSFHKCYFKLSKTLNSSLELFKQSDKDLTEELTLRVPKARDQVYFGQPAATTDVAESRLSVVRDVLSHRAFIGLGNREVNVTEYLPALRSICRLQKAKEEGKTKRRFLHYLEGIHLELPKATLSSLAANFP